MTFAQTLNAIAGDLIPVLNSLSADPSPGSQADAIALTRVINSLLTDAMQANALDLETKLASDEAANKRLQAFTTEASTAAQKIAQSEGAVSKFVSFANDVGKVLVAGAGGNVVAIGGALVTVCKDLGIKTP